ncbi:MAG: glycosyltransferase family 9 protein [Chitinophagaceae bacterium]|nr:glycosyltransferase family 9 protein [Chitinophagaceae bacterium]
MKHILVIRFSAMGDVAMMVPVIKNALDQNPHLQITVVSNAFFAPLFAGLKRCNFHPAQLKTTHQGASGIYELFRELVKQYRFDVVADLHSVLRSSLLRTFFRLSGYQTAVVDKGRKEKTALTRKEHKVFQQLTTTYERYAAVFSKLGIKISLDSSQPVYHKQLLPVSVQPSLQQHKKIIGVAPFAQHKEKMYPIEKMKEVVKTLSAENNVLLFGGGAEESFVLEQWAKEMGTVQNMAGKFSFAEELAIISNLDAMISMDSANMHLASLYNVPVISIWGATHPYAGFYGWAQPASNIVSVELPCRPCSVFGNKPCWRGDHACMEMISEKMILEKIN